MSSTIAKQMQELKDGAEGMLAGRAGWDRSEYGDGQFDSGVFASQLTGERWMAWHSLGEYLENEPVMTYDRVRERVPAFASDYAKVPAKVEAPDGAIIDVPGWRGVMRIADRTMLGYVSAEYPLIPPSEAFTWLDDLLNDDQAKVISAVMLRGGAQMVITVELPGHIKVAGWDDETIRKMIVLTNSFDSKGALAVACSPVRGECINSTRLVFSKSPRVWRTRHTKGMRDRMQEARTTLQLSSNYFLQVEETANRMVSDRMTRRRFDAFMKRLVPYTPQMQAKPEGRASKNRDRIVQAITDAYTGHDNLANVTGTKWGALQAVLEWNQWDRPTRDTKRDGKVLISQAENRFHRAVMRENPLETRAMKLLVG